MFWDINNDGNTRQGLNKTATLSLRAPTDAPGRLAKVVLISIGTLIMTNRRADHGCPAHSASIPIFRWPAPVCLLLSAVAGKKTAALGTSTADSRKNAGLEEKNTVVEGKKAVLFGTETALFK